MKGFQAASTSAADRERVLVMGGPGTGKTKAGLAVAKMMMKTHSKRQVYVIDTDFSWERMMGGKEYGELDNVTVATTFGYDEQMDALTKFRKLIVPGDWLIHDMNGPFWDTCQAHYIEKAFGMSKTDYFLQKKKAEQKTGSPFEAMDWQITKSYFQDFTLPLFYRHQGHVLVTTGVKAVQASGKWADSKDIIETYGRVGVRPEGEKRTGHHVHTILLFRQKKDAWTMTTVKDREREPHADTVLTNWALGYLRKTAGWKMG